MGFPLEKVLGKTEFFYNNVLQTSRYAVSLNCALIAISSLPQNTTCPPLGHSNYRKSEFV